MRATIVSSNLFFKILTILATLRHGFAVAFDVCACQWQVSAGSRCFDSLALAVIQGGVVLMGGTQEVNSPIHFNNDVEVVGVPCRGRPQVVGTFHSAEQAIFMPTNPSSQNLVFRNFDITSQAGKCNGGLRGLGSEYDSGSQLISLKVYNVHAYNLWSQKPGAVFFVGTALEVYIDDSSSFRNNRVMSHAHGRFAGGGVLAIINVVQGASITIRGHYLGNTAFFPGASDHANGGAIYIDWNDGNIQIPGTFNNNRANQGGAVHLEINLGTVTVSGKFTNNHAQDTGSGARAGAVRVLVHSAGSVMTMSGVFINNIADGRGGVMASNTVRGSSVLTFTGIFRNNKANGGNGGVWSQWSGRPVNGQVIFDGSATFTGNTARRGTGISGTCEGFSLSEYDWIPGETVTLY